MLKPVACGACGWTGRRKPGKLVVCPPVRELRRVSGVRVMQPARPYTPDSLAD